jgi:transposase
MSAEQVGDHRGAIGQLAAGNRLLADRGYDASWLREALQHKETKPCIAGRKSCTTTFKHDKHRYKRRNHIEIMFGRLTDWRRVATRLATKARKPAFLPSHRQQP